jgi:hypothetical protein
LWGKCSRSYRVPVPSLVVRGVTVSALQRTGAHLFTVRALAHPLCRANAIPIRSAVHSTARLRASRSMRSIREINQKRRLRCGLASGSAADILHCGRQQRSATLPCGVRAVRQRESDVDHQGFELPLLGRGFLLLEVAAECTAIRVCWWLVNVNGLCRGAYFAIAGCVAWAWLGAQRQAWRQRSRRMMLNHTPSQALSPRHGSAYSSSPSCPPSVVGSCRRA